MEIKNQLYKILKKQLSLDDVFFTLYPNDGLELFLIDELKCDLLDLYDILKKIETEFNISLTDEEYFSCKTVYDLYKLILKKLCLKRKI